VRILLTLAINSSLIKLIDVYIGTVGGDKSAQNDSETTGLLKPPGEGIPRSPSSEAVEKVPTDVV